MTWLLGAIILGLLWMNPVHASTIFSGTQVVKDGTGVILTIPITQTDGTPITGLLFNSAGATAAYCRGNASGACTTITLTGTCTLGAFTEGCFLEKDSTYGVYQLHVPNAAFATGTDRGTVVIDFTASTPTIIPYELINVGLAAIATTLGTPVTASMSLDTAAIQTVIGTTPFQVDTTTGVLGAKSWQRNVAGQRKIPILFESTTGAAVTGLGTSFSVSIFMNGATTATAGTGTKEEVTASPGLYYYAPSQADTNCNPCLYIFSGSGARTYRYEMITQ